MNKLLFTGLCLLVVACSDDGKKDNPVNGNPEPIVSSGETTSSSSKENPGTSSSVGGASQANSTVSSSSQGEVASNGCKSITVGGFTTWCGNLDYPLTTGLDDGRKTSGYWNAYTDVSEGGASKIEWPFPTGNQKSGDALDPVIEHCGGVCGHFALDEGSLDSNPYVGVELYVAGEDVDGNSQNADASDWGGICITYSASYAPYLELNLGETFNSEIKLDLPTISLDRSSTAMTKHISWDEFSQAGWGVDNGGVEMPGPEAAKKLSSIRFVIQGKSGFEGEFNIMAFGPYNGGCVETDSE